MESVNGCFRKWCRRPSLLVCPSHATWRWCRSSSERRPPRHRHKRQRLVVRSSRMASPISTATMAASHADVAGDQHPASPRTSRTARIGRADDGDRQYAGVPSPARARSVMSRGRAPGAKALHVGFIAMPLLSGFVIGPSAVRCQVPPGAGFACANG